MNHCGKGFEGTVVALTNNWALSLTCCGLCVETKLLKWSNDGKLSLSSENETSTARLLILVCGLFNLPCLTRLFHSLLRNFAPHPLSSTPVKTWKVINKCPLCCRTNTDGIWLTHGGLAEPWACRRTHFTKSCRPVWVTERFFNCRSGVMIDICDESSM